MTRTFELDHQLLQREQKKGVAGWLTLAAYLGVGGISFCADPRRRLGPGRLEKYGGGPPDESAEPAGVGPAKEIDEGPKPGSQPATA